MADSLADATARLEAAVERLAVVAGRPRPDDRSEEVAELSRRLDAALTRLRAALREEADLPPDSPDGEPVEPEPDDLDPGERRDVSGSPRPGVREQGARKA